MNHAQKDAILLRRYSDTAIQFYANTEVSSFLREIVEEQASNKGDFVLCDLGCGDGAVLFALSNQGLLEKAKAIVGVDISPKRIERLGHLKEAGLGQIMGVVSDACSVEQLADESFDLVICSQLIEHVQDDGALAAEIHRLLKQDGKAYISSVLRKRPGIWIYRNNGKWVLDPTHRHEYASDKELILLLERNALVAVKTNVILCRYSVVDMAIRLLIRIGLFDPDNARHVFLRHRFLNALRGLSLPIPGFYVIEVICRKGETKHEK